MSNQYVHKFGFILLMTLLLISSTASLAKINEGSSTNIDPNAASLTIATRHDSTIYNKYIAEFVKSGYGKSVGITSASQIEVLAPSTYEGFVTYINSPAINVDLAWGGGPTLFNNLADHGLLDPITDQSLIDWIDANVSDTIAGANMKSYDGSNQLMWAAAAISSFGFTVNNDELAKRGLDKPTTWEDLASPDFFTSYSEVNIGMGNAPDTTSNTRIYQIILQKYGWEKGWEMLYRMAGNSKIYGGSVETRSSVISGETAVAMTIDFYGLIAQAENPATEYVIPEGSSIVNGDPIALTKDGAHTAAAVAFTKFVLSQKGQALWLAEGINRLPVRADAFQYTDTLSDSALNSLLGKTHADVEKIETVFNNTLANQGIDFDEDLALSLESAMIYHFAATITNVHTELRTAWSKMVSNLKGGAYPEWRFEEISQIFGEPAITQAKAQEINSKIISDSSFRVSQQSDWADFSLNKFDDVETEITAPFTQTTTSNGTVVTSTFKPSSVDQGFQDIPFNSFFMAIALITSTSLVTYLRRRKNKL